jgi:hypothetical protein
MPPHFINSKGVSKAVENSLKLTQKVISQQCGYILMKVEKFHSSVTFMTNLFSDFKKKFQHF